MLPGLKTLDLKDKRVLFRVDFNVPISDAQVTDRSRIEAVIPTIRYCLEQGARVALASHLGRPKGEPVARYSLLPVAQVLGELLNVEVLFPESCVGDSVRKLISELRPPKELILLENLRFHPGEEANDPQFAKQLARPFNVYLTEAFGVLHRAHASTVGVLDSISECAVGPLVEAEVQVLDQIRQTPERPFAAILGGAKVSDKIGILEKLSQHVEVLVIGGGMAYTFLVAQGYEVGTSLVETHKIQVAKRILKRLETKGIKLYLPVDHVVYPEFPRNGITNDELRQGSRIMETDAWKEGMGLDIGPESARLFAEALQGVRTIFWNGPMGVFEYPAFAEGTLAVGRAVANSPAFSVVGGGDSVAAIQSLGLAKQIGHLSTGGGASLTYLEEGELVALKALRQASERR